MTFDRGKYYEEFEIGDKYVTMGRTVTETDIVNFVTAAGLFEELFLNQEYIQNETSYGSMIAPGGLTYIYAEGLAVQTRLTHNTGVAFLGMTLKVHAPTHVNDTIHCELEVTEKRETKNPKFGIITFTHTVRNQRGEAILTYTPTRMIRRREG